MNTIFRNLIVAICLAYLSGCSYAEKRNFMNKCATRPDAEPICSCGWDKLSQHYSASELNDIFSGYHQAPASFSRDFQQVELECEGQIPAGMN